MGTETREREECLLRHRTLEQDHIREYSTTVTVKQTGELLAVYRACDSHQPQPSGVTPTHAYLVHVCVYTLLQHFQQKYNVIKQTQLQCEAVTI